MEKLHMKAAPSMQLKSNGRLQRQLLGFRAAQSKPPWLSLPSLRCEAGKPEAFQRGHQGTGPDLGELTSPRERRVAEGRGPHAAPQPTRGYPHRWQPHSRDGWRPQEKTSKGTSLPAYNKAKAPSHKAGPAQGQALHAHLRGIFFPPTSSKCS